MRRKRTIYFNDARHYYLFVFEPPMRLEDAWVAIDEVAGTAVDTFSYGVSRGDGLFYPSNVGMRFGADIQPFDIVPYWRVWENMQSLIDRGLDPLQVLIDRAHDKGLDFFASLRMGGFDGFEGDYEVAKGGRGYAHEEAREYQFSIIEELATRYPIEGVELDFAAAPSGNGFYLREEDVEQYAPVITDFVRRAAAAVRQRPGTAGEVGARVYPTLEMNRKVGLEVDVWLEEGLVDYVVPMLYSCFILDADMPIDWIVEAAHAKDISVYSMLQPYYREQAEPHFDRPHPTPQMMRAAAANAWDRGVDGLYTWFMSWPLGDGERSTLTELGDAELVREKDKHYFLRWRKEDDKEFDYPAYLPLEISAPDAQKRYEIPFAIADDTQNPRLRNLRLRLGIVNLVMADKLEILLNGESLSSEICKRTYLRSMDPYTGQWLEFDLQEVRPQKGRNMLEICLKERPLRMGGSITVKDVEIVVTYDTYPVGRTD
jgi:hypothetical protein